MISKDNLTYTLKPESVTYFTTDYITKSAPVEAEVLEVSDGLLRWSEVDDENHCYYRVYSSDSADFIPSRENQIASTVATELSSDRIKRFVKVLSVDTSGNV